MVGFGCTRRSWRCVGIQSAVEIGAGKLGCSLRTGVQVLGLFVAGDYEHRLLSSPVPLLPLHSLPAQDITKLFNHPRTLVNHL